MENDSNTAQSNSALTPKPQRTPGLWATDALIYPLVNNFGVFATSVFFTYLTNKGEKFGKPGTVANYIGSKMQLRGDWLEGHFMNWGLPKAYAENLKMVFWSFADGSLLAPAIKKFEDRREDIARSIDRSLGTEPETDAPYHTEPKQTWWSVLGGRFITAGIVVPTAAFLNKVDFHNGAFKWALDNGSNLNERMFFKPGINLGNTLMEWPSITSRFSKDTIEEVAKVTYFEAFYTTVCTVGLYLTSRFIASHTGSNTKGEALSPTGQPMSGYATAKDNPLKLSNLMKAEDKEPKTPDNKVHKPTAHVTLSSHEHEAQLA